MTASYRWVQWNKHKLVYDAVVVGGCLAFLLIFVGVSVLTRASEHQISPPVLAMRGLGSLGIILLHIILVIGPLARLTPMAAPLLYNRRHLGVIFFVTVFLHGLIAIGFYGGFGIRNPALALLAPPGSFASISAFPFEVFGFAALLIFIALAATSHDFWLKQLSPRVWKSLHMLVYFAYALVLAHVAMGPLYGRGFSAAGIALIAGALGIGSIHLIAGFREWRRDARPTPNPEDGWLDVAAIDEIQPDHAKIVCPAGSSSIAIFRHADGFSGVENRCAHQGGPLGEGRIIDGCITCPWHGYQYRPESGQSPPPYTEKLHTYQVRINGDRVLVNINPQPPGTRVESARTKNQGTA